MGKKQVCYMFDFWSACCEARRLFLYAKAGKNESFCSGKLKNRCLHCLHLPTFIYMFIYQLLRIRNFVGKLQKSCLHLPTFYALLAIACLQRQFCRQTKMLIIST